MRRLAAAGLLLLTSTALAGETTSMTTTDPHPYIGMWVTEDGRIRHEPRDD